LLRAARAFFDII